MKKPEEIKRGLEHCRNGAPCLQCEYAEQRDHKYTCEDALFSDALTYVLQLEQINTGFAEQTARLEAQVPKWISIKRRIPKRGYKVLVINGHGYISIYAFWSLKSNKWTWVDESGHFNHVNDITYWMPLPKAPKEG